MAIHIAAEAKTDKYEQTWLEVGLLRGEHFASSPLRYPNADSRLICKRTFDTWSNGDGRHQTVAWDIEVPDNYPLNIVKAWRTKDGKEYERLY